MIKDEDLQITTGCIVVHPEHMGGQHVAMACSGVRVLHVPSGIAVSVTDERSQHRNKIKCIMLLELCLTSVGWGE